MASRGRNVLLRLTGDSSDAKRALNDVRSDLRRMSREEARVRLDIQTARAERQIDTLRANLERLSKQQASPKVDLQTARAREQLALLEFRLDRLRLKRVNVDVDVKRGTFERAAAGLTALDRGVDRTAKGFAGLFTSIPFIGSAIEGALGGAFAVFDALGNAVSSVVSQAVTGLSRLVGTSGALAGPIASAAGSLVSMGLSLAGLGAIAGAVVIALNAILGAIVALGGALAALIASAAAAAAGLGALAIAFGAVLIPVAIVAFGVFTRFQAILKAHTAQQQAVAQATQAAKTAEQAHTQALQQRQRAEEQLAAATVAGRDAMKQAAVDERDAELGLANARNGVQDSRLQLALAKRDLREFLKGAQVAQGSLDSLFKKATDVSTSPAQQRSLIGDIAGTAKGKIDPLDLRQKIQAVRDAQLGVANATNQTAHAEDTLTKARQKEADFTKRGLDAYKPYVTALRAVAQADQRVARTSEQTSAAQRKYQQALKGLSTTEQGTLGRLNQLIDGFKRLAKAFTDPIFRALNDTFDKLKGHAGDFTGVLTELGKAFADVVTAMGRFLTEPRTLAAFQTLAIGAADLVRQLGAHAFTSFLRIMREVATTALPAVTSAARSVSGWLGHIAAQPARIHRAVSGVITQFRAWLALAGAVARLVISLFSNAAGSGKSLVTSLTRIVNRWRAWIDANPERVRAFFHDAVQKTREIVHWLAEAFHWLAENLPKAAHTAQAALKVFGAILDPFVATLRSALGLLGKIIGLIGKIPHVGDIIKKGLENITPLGNLLHRQTGGIVPGIGRGDIVPAMLEPGEFVLRRSVVQALGLPALRALNSGSVPQVAGAVHHHTWNLPAPLGTERFPDPQNMLALVQQAWNAAGGGLT